MASPKVPKALRGLVSSVMKYRELRKAGKVGKISALEEASKYVGKRGGILKRETRYKTGQKRLQEAKESIKKLFDGQRPSKKAITEYAKKEAARVQKAAESYARKYMPDNRFKRIAREKASKFGQMVDVFASETYNKLVAGAYGIGSDVVEKLLDEGLTPDEVEEYLKQVRDTIKDYPTEARKFVNNDEFWSAVVELSNTIGSNDILQASDVLTAYMGTDPDNRQYFEAALQNYAELNDSSKTFAEVWEELQNTQDPASIDNMSEILESEE